MNGGRAVETSTGWIPVDRCDPGVFVIVTYLISSHLLSIILSDVSKQLN